VDISEQITEAKKETTRAKAQLLRIFEFVPEDKLNWSPSSTARTALQIVAHCGVANSALAAVLRGEPMPLPMDPEAARILIRNGGKGIATREAAVQVVEDSLQEVLQALDTVTEERFATVPPSPFGSIPFPIWMGIPSSHMDGHANQINYLQTVWGDHDDH